MIDSTYEDKLYQTPKFAGAFRYNAQKNCAALSCRALRRVARMCSSTLSVNCEYVEKDTVVKKQVEKLKGISAPTKTKYKVGEALDFSNFILSFCRCRYSL